MTKLIAVTLSDGSLDKKRYTVSFTEDEDVVKRLVEEFKEIEGINLNWKLDKQENSLRARVYSKELVEKMLKLTASFRTRAYNIHPRNPEIESENYPDTEIPKECFSEKEKIRNFLRYYSTCDGGPEFSAYERGDIGKIQLHVGIKIGCKNPIIKEQIYGMLKKMKINSSIKKDGISIRKLDEIEKFQKEIGFLDEAKVRRGKLFRGYSKNDVVRLMLICGSFTKESNWINKNFETKEEFQNFMLECMKLINDKKGLSDITKQKLSIVI